MVLSKTFARLPWATAPLGHRTPGTWHLAPGTWHLAPGTWQGTLPLAPLPSMDDMSAKERQAIAHELCSSILMEHKDKIASCRGVSSGS